MTFFIDVTVQEAAYPANQQSMQKNQRSVPNYYNYVTILSQICKMSNLRYAFLCLFLWKFLKRSQVLIHRRLQLAGLPVGITGSKQRFVRVKSDHPAVLKKQDFVRIPDARHAVRNKQNRLVP